MMLFDDRLTTVLRLRTDSPAGERTQFRQLLDLLGAAQPDETGATLADAGYARLAELLDRIPTLEQALILREAGLRLRNPQLLHFLAGAEPRTAASAMATAQLPDAAWQQLIPRLPVTARGFLRHRRDLPPGARRVLRQLGVVDLVLPPVTVTEQAPEAVAVASPSAPATRLPHPSRAPEPIGAILVRIEQFREARRAAVLSPRLPLGDSALPEAARIESFDAVTDAAGVVCWASGAVAPWLVGMALADPHPGPLASLTPTARLALRQHQPLQAQPLTLAGAPAICGAWLLDAAPAFDRHSGGFTGYRCRLRRPALDPAELPVMAPGVDRMRQLLHELRTPVNAIQGFAEIIQQQLFGTVPHEYRAQAAAIAGDAARLLSGFEEVERLVQLEGGTLAVQAGECDLGQAVAETLERLAGVLRPREAAITLAAASDPVPVALDRSELRGLCWRVLASVAAALGQGEQVVLHLVRNEKHARLDLHLPAALQAAANQAPRPAARRPAVTAGMFGPQFTFRLAAAEARAAGGALEIRADRLSLSLPLLTVPANDHSTARQRVGG